ncbi:MAG: HAMP domain-containing protein [Roseateles sp.]|nr:MAG: HAMP domain-containing protein [Roseateles sp.]
MKLNAWKLRTRVIAGFSLVMALLAVASIVSILRLSALSERIDHLVETDMHVLELSREWAGLSEGNILRRIVSLVVEDQGFVKAFTARSKKITEQIDRIQKELNELSTDPESLALIKAVDESRKQYQAARESVNKSKAQGEDITRSAVAELLPAMENYLGAIDKFATHTRSLVEATRQQAQQDVRNTRLIAITLLASALVLGVLIALVITRSVTEPLQQAQGLSQAIAGGDLSRTLRVEGSDELAALNRELLAMQQRLAHTITGVRGAADQVQLASAEIATGNSDLSQRTEQTASNLEQTGAAMAQLGDSVRLNADSAREADQLARSATTVAERGGDMVQQVVSTMSEIQQSSNRIADIIGVIDGIAFQTNILALNAAVEAARAGEQGRGFAVVAGEVRSLAQRSATAAREIKSLISASVERVDGGSRLVADTGETMREVVASVQRVSRIIGEISSASAEQANTLGEIGQAVQQLDQMTQQNAALVEQSAAAAESLREQSAELVSSVAGFRLG